MAGFNRNVDIELEDIETDIDDDLEIEDDYKDEVIPNKSRNSGGSSSRSNSRSNPRRNPRGTTRGDSEDNSEDDNIIRKKPNNSNSMDNKTIIYVVIGVVVLVLVVGLFFMNSSKKKKEAELAELQKKQEENVKNSNTGSSVEPGIPNFYGVGADENDAYLYDSKLITKDLNGSQVATNYTVLDSEEVTDYITYKKYRSAMGNGLEFYWLEAEYKGQPYKVQVPYSVYSKLDYSGITVVDMEVLHLEGGSKMITYMTVREDAKSLLEQR